ncbi:MAG: radical SAM protein [Planctomycetes bacterium]|nr:radical SAM protein [Planctomycetota bacterium]
MKVTLISPPSPFLINQKAFPPLGILYLAAILERHNIEVEVVDLADKEKELIETLELYAGADLYGISATTPQYPQALIIKKILCEQNKKNLIAVGGAHPSSVPNNCIKDGFDFVVLGEGENALLQIVNNLKFKKPQYGEIRAQAIQDLDSIPIPARHLIDINSYAYDIDGGRGTTIITSRGCPYACAFCSKDGWQTGTRFHGAKYVISELEHIITTYGIKHFLFLDDTLTLHKSRLLELCRLMVPLNIKWRCYARSSTSKEKLIAMKEAGCVEIGVGVESGSQKILDSVNKKETVDQNTKFVELCKEIGIIANVFIMIGLPGETYKTVEETRQWMEHVRPQKFGFNIFMPYAGTPIFNNPEKYDIRIYEVPDEKSWVKGRQGEYQSFVSTNELSREEIVRLFEESFNYYTELTNWQPGVGKK